MFELSDKRIDHEALKAALATPEAGACATFEGWVRNHNAGEAVQRLEYESYPEVAVKEGQRIIDEARERYNVHKVHCVHRTGTLEIGDMAVWVGVTASHRDDAFKACRYIIDETKARVPIWKKEYYLDGDSGWINCETRSEPAPPLTEAAYYDRQTRLPDVGEAGQWKLRESRLLVIGAGGLGSPALSYLAAAGIGTLGICEGDRLEASNLHRQTLFCHDAVGGLKAELAAERLREQNPFITVRTHPERLTTESAEALFAAYDLVLDCTDNFETKFLINDAAVLTQTPVIFASIYQYDGQLFLVNPRDGGPCMRCMWPEVPEPGCVGSCAEVGVLGAVPGVFGAMQAIEAIKFIIGLPGVLGRELILFDCLTYASQKLPFPKDPACPVCGERPTIQTIDIRNYDPNANLELDIVTITLAEYTLIDIREPDEIAADPLEGIDHERIPMSEWDVEDPPIDAKTRYLLSCARGMRSKSLAGKLRERGYKNVYSAIGGAEAFKTGVPK
jgi:sulfur-carrier protein adenylyltransferase/sulfurtransferase